MQPSAAPGPSGLSPGLTPNPQRRVRSTTPPSVPGKSWDLTVEARWVYLMTMGWRGGGEPMKGGKRYFFVWGILVSFFLGGSNLVNYHEVCEIFLHTF